MAIMSGLVAAPETTEEREQPGHIFTNQVPKATLHAGAHEISQRVGKVRGRSSTTQGVHQVAEQLYSTHDVGVKKEVRNHCHFMIDGSQNLPSSRGLTQTNRQQKQETKKKKRMSF